MSHFLLAVILPKGPVDDIGAKIEELLSPFDENKEVVPYDEPCFCVGRKAKVYAHNEAWGDIDFVRAEFASRHSGLEDVGEFDRLWVEEEYGPREQRVAELLASHPLNGVPDSDCTECSGSGKRTSTYNPLSRWDWYRVGGRWDGLLLGEKAASDDGGFNFSEKHETLGNNSQVVDLLIDKSIIPFAVLTPDGEWHQRGQMGFWGVVKLPDGRVEGPLGDDCRDSVENWKSSVLSLYEKYRGHMAVGIDCHI